MLACYTRPIRAVLLGAAILFVLIGPIKPAGAEDTDSYSLKDALDNNFVKALVCAVGASSGPALIMAIKSQVSSALRITMPSGTIFSNGNSAGQSMVAEGVIGEYKGDLDGDIAEKCAEAAEEQEKNQSQPLVDQWYEADSITLDPHQEDVYLLSAYCLEFEKANPEASDRLTAAGTADGEVAQLFDYLDGRSDDYSSTVVQLATWAVSGNVSGDHVAAKFEFSSQDKNEACDLLLAAGINASGKALCSQ